MLVSRRSLLTQAFALGAVLPVLASCGTNSFAAGLQQATSDVSLIATGLQSSLAQLTALNVPGMTPGTLAKIGTAIGEIQTVNAALGSVATATQAQPLIAQLEAAINALVATAATLPLPPQIQLPIAAAAILLPVIETAIGLAVSAATQAQANAAQSVVTNANVAKAVRGENIHDIARDILRGH